MKLQLIHFIFNHTFWPKLYVNKAAVIQGVCREILCAQPHLSAVTLHACGVLPNG